MANTPQSITVEECLATLTDEQTVQDSRELVSMMKTISGHDPVIWNVGTIGFDTYHYKYDSGREGDCHVLGFYPRDGKITFYLMDGTEKYSNELETLGKHTISKACLYIKRLNDIDIKQLEKVLQASYAYIKSKDGQMHRM